KPVERRDRKSFEPPPWERQAFEELERQRATETALSSESEPVQELAGTAGPTGAEAVPPVTTFEAARARHADASDGEQGGGGVSEAEMLELLAGLAQEEPPPVKSLLGVAIGSGLVLVALGGMLMIWGIAALVGARRTGWIGQVTGGGLGMFGVFFLGMGVWMLYRTLKQRGVL
ncbi:MAG TPA: hypothetical protein VLA05_12140, partial [Coriobacteriia bacterium]|nr:hypothetical protein [Coriobacteriia bacterium]